MQLESSEKHTIENTQKNNPENNENLNNPEQIIENRTTKTAVILSKILENSTAKKFGKIPGPNVLYGTVELILNKKSNGEALSGKEKIVRVLESTALAYILMDLGAKYFLGTENPYVDMGAISAKGLSWASFAAGKIIPKIQELGAKEFVISQLTNMAVVAKNSKNLLNAVAVEAKKYSPDLFDSRFIELNLMKIEK